MNITEAKVYAYRYYTKNVGIIDDSKISLISCSKNNEGLYTYAYFNMNNINVIVIKHYNGNIETKIY